MRKIGIIFLFSLLLVLFASIACLADGNEQESPQPQTNDLQKLGIQDGGSVAVPADTNGQTDDRRPADEQGQAPIQTQEGAQPQTPAPGSASPDTAQ